ncbi:MAG: hypothetical protein PHT03_04140 [Bacilli bacterium]|nr:hypothetical protein [Bacilli bacterium]MDD4387792.1 hypothetical protein [Bacilli bacterium]
MKWSLQQLHKYGKATFPFETEYDFTEEIKNIDDILGITPAIVKGNGVHIRDDRFKFEFHISVILYLQDAITLDPVEFPLELSVIEIFDKELFDDDTRLIEKNTIELRDVIWESILLEKPMRVVKDETQ